MQRVRYLMVFVVACGLIALASCTSEETQGNQNEEGNRTTAAEPEATATVRVGETPVTASTEVTRVVPSPTAIPTSTEVVTPTAIEVPEVTMAPEPEPTPTEFVAANTEVSLSREYLNPEIAITIITRELSGNPNESAWGLTNERAYYLRAAYHLATAEVGHFNADTTEFNSWLYDYLEAYRSNDAESIADRDVQREHLRSQVWNAIYQPESELAQRLRSIELGDDPSFSAPGYEAYWWYLFGPYGEAVLDQFMLERMTIAFFKVVDEYEIATVLTGEDIDFLSFLQDSEFIDVWFEF